MYLNLFNFSKTNKEGPSEDRPFGRKENFFASVASLFQQKHFSNGSRLATNR